MFANSPLFSRRHLLQAMGGGFGSIALAGLLAPTASATPAVARGPHFAPRAKRIIHLFMNGGPFGPDLLDPKPALNRFAGQRPQAVDLRTENPTGGLMAVPFRFAGTGRAVWKSVNCCRTWPRVHRRYLRPAVGAHRQSQPRPRPVHDEQRHHRPDSAQHGRLALLWPGHARMPTCPPMSCSVPAGRCASPSCGAAASCRRRTSGDVRQPHQPRPAADDPVS